MDYNAVAGMNGANSWKKIVRAIAKLRAGDRKAGLKLMRFVMNDTDADDAIRAQAFRRFMAAADDHALENFADQSDDLPRGIWREIQPKLMHELTSRQLKDFSTVAHLALPEAPSRRPASDESSE